MFATCNDQENLAYGQQQAAAAKSLNQGIKGLAPKTPGNKAPKTPFRVPLNDENTLKTGGKGGKATLFDGKGGKPDAFVTPAGPRQRAPLGAKTTNAKATAFQTPAPLTGEKQSVKPSSPRLRRAKIKIHEAETAKGEDGEEEREIECMPPREVPLPDHPDDWPNDREYPMFEGRNLTKGWWSEFAGSRKSEEEEDAESQKLRDEAIMRSIDRDPILGHGVRESPMQSKTKPRPVSREGQKQLKRPLGSKPAPTVKARSAAAAPAAPPTARPSFAAPTAAAKARLPAAPTRKEISAAPLIYSQRHAAAKAASNTTLGYSKGRAVSATARRPLTEIHGKSTAAPSQTLAADAELDKWLFDKSLSFDEDDEFDVGDGRLGGVALPKLGEDEALVDFALGVPET